MCGLAGILSLSPDAPVDAADLRTMANELRHRGPDDDGFYVDPQRRCGFGFRRLSIIDLAGGHQPIGNEDGTIHLVFNGEIYNFRELRSELAAAGHRFGTESDSEVVVHAYEQWAEQCFAKLAGMFAIAIWDERRGRLLLARDRLGKKPLVFRRTRNAVQFASEAKAIYALSTNGPEISPQSLHSYLMFQYVPAPSSIDATLTKVLPGCYLSFDVAHAGSTRQVSYWNLPGAEFVGDYDQAKADLGALLTRAVEKRLVADVPLGAFLSGGIDSSIVVGLMRKLGVSPLRTFSIGFADPRYDESSHARRVAAHFHTEHHEHVVTPQARDIIDILAYHYDEPLADSSAIPTYFVSKYTRASVTVALTGDGGDECFGGYDRYRAALLAARGDLLPIAVRSAIAAAATAIPRSRPRSLANRAFRLLRQLGQSPSRRYLGWMNVFTPEQLASAYSPDFAARIRAAEPIESFERLYNSSTDSLAARAIRTDLQTYLPYDLLAKVDIASMANGLECRCPFLDHELVEFALSLPIEWRVNTRGGKRILKDWAAGLLPPEILNRPKMGFGVPIGQWFRAELRDLLEQRLFAPDSLARRIFRVEWLRDLFSAHQDGRANHEHGLWALLMLESWNRRWRASL